MAIFRSIKSLLMRIMGKYSAPLVAIEPNVQYGDLISNVDLDSQSVESDSVVITEEVDQPIWKLVLKIAERLQTEVGDFRMIDIVTEVQRIDPSRGRGSIQPVVQGMTSNAGIGPYSPCGEPLFRVSHGVYRLVGQNNDIEPSSAKETPMTSMSSIPRKRRAGNSEVEFRVDGVINEFSVCLETYDKQIPFTRSGQYSLHRETIERRRTFVSVRDAIEDEGFVRNFHQTLYAWGIGKRASRLVSLSEFRDRLSDCSEEISGFEHLRLDDQELDASLISIRLWRLIERLGVVQNVSLIVPGTKTLHHLLPDLIPPMDRAWTGAFFQWSMGASQYERMTFIRTFSYYAEIAKAVDPVIYVGDKWRTSRTKVLDNAIIGYCKLHDIKPRSS